MDACFDLMLAQPPRVPGLERRDTFDWNGVPHPEGVETYVWGGLVLLRRHPMPSHWSRFLPSDAVKRDWAIFAVDADRLNDWEAQVNGAPPAGAGLDLESVLRRILAEQETWAVVFELHCDRIDHVYRLGLDECLARLRRNLSYEASREGFIVLG